MRYQCWGIPWLAGSDSPIRSKHNMDVLLLVEQEVTDMGQITCDWLNCVTNVPDIGLVLAVLPERECRL